MNTFISGTDTGVGKTILTAALLAGLRARGVAAVPMKPVQTGCRRDGTDLRAPDLDLSLAAAGLDPRKTDQPDFCPFRYETACSPHLAAAREEHPVLLPVIEAAYGRLAQAHPTVLVEGAGGLRVPLDDRQDMLDLASALDLPVLLATRPALGTLNHSLLSLQALRQAGLTTLGLVVVESTPGAWGFIEQDNLETLHRRGGVPVYGPIPWLGPEPDTWAALPAFLGPAVHALAPLLDRLA